MAKKPKRLAVFVDLTPVLHEALDAAAVAHDVKRAVIVRWALKAYLAAIDVRACDTKGGGK